MRARRTGMLMFLLMAGIACAAPAKFIIADVVINGVVQPPVVISVLADGAILVRRDDLLSWNLDARIAPVEPLRDIDHVRLSALPGVAARLEGSTLSVHAHESAFRPTRIDLRQNPPAKIDGGKGAYLNYDVTAFGGSGQRSVAAAALESVFYADTLSFSSNGTLMAAGTGRKFVRHESGLHWDFPENTQSLTVGDSIGRSGLVARSFRFGGISIGTNFAVRPDLVTFALPTVPGESRIPTVAELLVNGQPHSHHDLKPGPFEISNVPAINGAGEIQLVTRDSLGRQQVLVVPYYVTPALLRHGLVEAGFEAGLVREDFGLASANYGRRFARGLFRKGLTEGVTADFFAEALPGQRTAGGGITLALGNVAVANLAAAVSGGEESGGTVSLSLERSARGISFGLRGQYVTRNFMQLGESAGVHYRMNANAGVSMGAAGNASFVHAVESRYGRGHISTSAISYQKQLRASVSLLANVSASRMPGGSHHFAGFALAMPLDSRTSGSLASTRQKGASEYMLDVRQNLPADEGWAARGRISSRPAGSTRLDSGLTWQNSLGQWLAEASRERGHANYRLGMAGSVVTTGGTVRAVRQLGDAFAIVSVPGFPGIDIYYENQRMASTDASGIAVIPRLRPYERNTINLDTLKLSLSTELRDARRTITPARRAGVMLQFKAAPTQGALVRIVSEEGSALPAGAVLKVGAGSFPVAANGEAWVTGLDGEVDAVAEWKGRRCAVHIPMAEKAKARPRIGPLTCREVRP